MAGLEDPILAEEKKRRVEQGGEEWSPIDGITWSAIGHILFIKFSMTQNLWAKFLIFPDNVVFPEFNEIDLVFVLIGKKQI